MPVTPMMKRRMLISGGAAAVAAVLFLRPLAGNSMAVTQPLTAPELVTTDARLVVDIREPVEWQQTGVLQGARLHSWRTPEEFVAAFGDQLAEGREIVLICRSGNRSGRAARQLSDYLNREVVDVKGGMLRILSEGDARIVAPSARMGCASCDATS